MILKEKGSNHASQFNQKIEDDQKPLFYVLHVANASKVPLLPIWYAVGVPSINAASELYHKLSSATGINTNYNSNIINPIAFLRYLLFIP